MDLARPKLSIGPAVSVQSSDQWETTMPTHVRMLPASAAKPSGHQPRKKKPAARPAEQPARQSPPAAADKGVMVLLLWRSMGLLAVVFSLVTIICVGVAYAKDDWENVSYEEADIILAAGRDGYSYASYPSYYTLTRNVTAETQSAMLTAAHLPECNRTDPASDGAVNGSANCLGETTARPVQGETITLALAKRIKNGMFSICDTVESSTRQRLTAAGVIWLIDCRDYTSSGASEFSINTPERFRHVMTRLSQACMIVSTICIAVTLGLGLFSFIWGQVVASVVTATIGFAGALYQLFVGITMVRRMNESGTFLTGDASTHLLSLDARCHAGESLTLVWIATGFATVSGALWLVVWRLLRTDVKCLEKDQSGLYDYNRCCRPYRYGTSTSD